MHNIVRSEIECAVELFFEGGDLSQMALRNFMMTKIRSIKVDYPHVDSRWINKEVALVWEEISGVPLALLA